MVTTLISEALVIEIFKTNVNDKCQAERLVRRIQSSFDLASVNFDLEDCDRILRIAGSGIDVFAIHTFLEKEGFYCQVLY